MNAARVAEEIREALGSRGQLSKHRSEGVERLSSSSRRWSGQARVFEITVEVRG